MADAPTPLMLAADAVAKELNADIFLFSASINRANYELFRQSLCPIKNKKPNALLVLTTNGGDPDAAFLLARAIKQSYKKFIVAVMGTCKSAGTLIVIGADEIVMSDCGELGPLDIQLGKDDELFKRGSGLDMTEAIRFLQDLSWSVFQQNFIKLKQGTNITTKTAAEIAQGIAQGIVGPIASQIDPVKLGESQRSLVIAREYGKLLNPKFEQFDKLISGYPSHSFVIDRLQAEGLFQNVRKATAKEESFEDALDTLAHTVVDIVHYFTPIVPPNDPAAPQPAGAPPGNDQPPAAAQ